jgi:hypothetical protein
MAQITLAELEVGKQYTGASSNGNTTTIKILSIKKRGSRYKVDISCSHYHVERNEVTQRMKLGRKYLLGDLPLFEFYAGLCLINSKI